MKKIMVYVIWLAVIAFNQAPFYATASDATLTEDDIGEMSLEALFKLDVVTVTARKRTENMQDVPASVSALQGEKLDVYSSSGEDIRFLNAKIPSLTIETSFGRTFPRFYIRGLGNTDFDLNGSQPVSLVFDNVVLENPILKGFPVFDLERIEVLRGPQGTLFGRNTPAGLIKFDSRKPSQTYDAIISAAHGTNTTTDIKGAVGGGISDTVALRLAFMHQEKANWIDNQAPNLTADNVLGGHKEQAYRLQLGYRPNDHWHILANYHWRDLDAAPIAFRANIISPGSNHLVAGFEPSKIGQDAFARSMQRVKSKGASLTLDYDTEKYTFTSISGYESTDILSHADVDGGHGDFLAGATPMGPGLILFAAESADGIPSHRQLSQEFRVSSNDLGIIDFQLGVFYFDESLTITSTSFNSIQNGVINGFAQQNQQTDAWALFGTLDYEINDKFNVTLGLRYSKDEKTFVAERLQNPSPWNGSPDHLLASANPEDSHISWDISSSYQLANQVNFYTRIADSFRAPSVQGRLLFGDEVTVAKSETILSIEAGIKADGLNGKGRINSSIFHYTMHDQQITAVGGNSNFNRLENVNKTVGYGFEVDAELALTRDFLITSSLSFNHTELKDKNLSVSICPACTVLDPLNGQGRAIIDGNTLPHAPKWIANLTGRYTWPVSIFNNNNGEIFVYSDWSYRSKINFLLYESVEFTGRPLLTGGLRIGYIWSTNQRDYELALFSRNITNQQRVIGGIDFNNLTGMINEGRFIGLEFKGRFF